MISEPACKSQVRLPKLRQISAPCDLASRDTSTLRLRIAWSQTGRHDSTGRFIPEFTTETWYWSETVCSLAGRQEVTSNLKQCFDAKRFTSDLIGFPNTGNVSAQSSTS